MKIKAAVLHQPNTPLVVEELDLQEPKAGEILVRLVATGVCHSDYHLVTGDTQHPLPVVLGHEGAGVVEAVGDGVTRAQVGDHVVLNWTPDCGECFYCQRGKPNLCDTYTGPIWNGVMLDGSPRLYRDGAPVYHYCGTACYAEYTTVPEQSCIPIRKDVPLKVASLIGCAVATGVGAALNTVQVRPGDSVVVFGCGGVGLNTIQGAAIAGATTVIAVDTNANKLEMARAFGATHTLLSDDKLHDGIRDLTGGRGADYAFEAVGLPGVQEQTLGAVRPGGTAVLVGLSPMGTNTNFPGAILTRQEKTVMGSYYGTVNPRRDFPLYVDLYASGRLKLEEMISREYALDEVNEAFEAMLSGEVARGILVF